MMNAKTTSSGADPEPGQLLRSMTGPIVAGLICWVALCVGFLLLKELMQERPEFVGPPIRAAKTVLVQPSPQVVMRKTSDDISVVRRTQPDFCDIRFDMKGRRDYRGLKTVSDMSGEAHLEYGLTNRFDEPVFVLFKCPHPLSESRTGQGMMAAELRLQASLPGVQENRTNAWIWSGMIPARQAVTIHLSYQAGSLEGVSYRAEDSGADLVRHLRIAFSRQDLPSLRFETGDGVLPAPGETVEWERKDFFAPDFFSARIVEGRSMFTSLAHLLEIGPLVSLLFLLAAMAVILTRQRLTVVQTLTLSAGYALYFPLILYLSARFSFMMALVIAVAVPGTLLLNYARWLLGARVGLLGGLLFLGLYQVFPTLAAFAGWNRGMVLLCLSVVTLGVLINLQNQALKRKALAAALILASLWPAGSGAAEVQVVLPAELAGRWLAQSPPTNAALVSFQPVQYRVRHQARYFEVEAAVAFQIVRPGDLPTPLFALPVHLQEFQLQPADASLGQCVTLGNRPGFFAQRTGAGALRFTYRVAVENRDGKKRAQIPLLLGASGNVTLESPRKDLEILTASLWSKELLEKSAVHQIGVAGEDFLGIEWRELDGGAAVDAKRQADGNLDFYGIGLTRAQNLTVINSDGSCTHFAEFELPAFRKDEFRLRLPADARLISVSVNGNEISSPPVEDRICRVRLPDRQPQPSAHQLSFRFAYPPAQLGFIGSLELSLPEVFQTTGTLEWVVAFPNGFDTQVISSGLEAQKAPLDLNRFGDYGRILKSHPQTCLAKDLAPPGVVTLNLKYRQLLPGINERTAD